MVTISIWHDTTYRKQSFHQKNYSVQFNSLAQSCPNLPNPMPTACQASLSITNSRCLLKLSSIESVMLSNHLILCLPLLFLPSIFPSIRVFSNESALRIRWPKYWSFSFNMSHSNEHPGLILFRMDWLDLLAIQGTLKSLPQHHSLNASILPGSAFLTSIQFSSEKAMAPHSSTLAWKIPWAEEPSGLQSMGLRRVGHDWVTSLSLFTFMHWRRKWQPTPVFLPGESQRRGSLVGCLLWVAQSRTRLKWLTLPYLTLYSSVQFSRSVMSRLLEKP